MARYGRNYNPSITSRAHILRSVRVRMKLTQAECGARYGIEGQTISAYERDVRPVSDRYGSSSSKTECCSAIPASHSRWLTPKGASQNLPAVPCTRSSVERAVSFEPTGRGFNSFRVRQPFTHRLIWPPSLTCLPKRSRWTPLRMGAGAPSHMLACGPASLCTCAQRRLVTCFPTCMSTCAPDSMRAGTTALRRTGDEDVHACPMLLQRRSRQDDDGNPSCGRRPPPGSKDHPFQGVDA